MRAALRLCQEFRTLLQIGIELGQHPHSPALQPDVLAGVPHRTVTIETIEPTTMLAIWSILHPERDDGTCQLVLQTSTASIDAGTEIGVKLGHVRAAVG